MEGVFFSYGVWSSHSVGVLRKGFSSFLKLGYGPSDSASRRLGGSSEFYSGVRFKWVQQFSDSWIDYPYTPPGCYCK